MTVHTMSADPPPAPVPLAAVRTGDIVQLSFTATVPQTFYGDSTFDVLHVRSADLVPARACGPGRRGSPTGRTRSRYPTRHPASLPDKTLRVQIKDPAGNVATSDPVTVS